MKNDLRKEVDEILKGKLADAIAAYQANRDQDFDELVALKRAIESLENERADVQKTMGALNTRKSGDLGDYNRLTQKTNWLDRQVRAKRNQANSLMSKLTQLNVDPEVLALVLACQRGGEENVRET